MASVASHAYRAPMFRVGDDLFPRCLVATTIAGVVFLIVIFLAPPVRSWNG